MLNDYRDRQFKRYHFLPHNNHLITEQVQRQSEKTRRAEDLELYARYRDDKSVQAHSDGSLSYFIISSEWIKKWRDFVNKKGPMPDQVENKPIAKYISDQRKDTRYRIHDNDVDIKEPEEVYILSEDFWSVFRDRYGCDIQIQIRKYANIDQLVPKPFRQGNQWSAFQNDPTAHYNEYDYLFSVSE